MLPETEDGGNDEKIYILFIMYVSKNSCQKWDNFERYRIIKNSKDAEVKQIYVEDTNFGRKY